MDRVTSVEGETLIDQGLCRECPDYNLLYLCEPCEVRWRGCEHRYLCWFCEAPGKTTQDIFVKEE